jgi:phthiocerol/phenolphthiocerol synthesis type-I polyketide synthase E
MSAPTQDCRSISLDLAVVGMSGRFPGAADLKEYWRVIAEGRETISRFSPEELQLAGVSAERLRHPGFVNAGGIVPDGENFDAAFFGYSAREAALMDPQQRLFLESAWHALEDAGYAPETAPGKVGVYAGQMMSTHRPLDHNAFLGNISDLLMSANDKDFLPSRVSYKLGLTGPSINVQATCSTSLVAIHLANQALLTFECDLALAGGVSWTSLRRQGYLHEPGGTLSADGHVRCFDRDASGFVPADGVGVVVLRRLADAVADGDRIYAVVKGAAVNNDGSARLSYAAPGVAGQRSVITEALAVSAIDPNTIGYVEAHGTGTAIGDLVEFSALTQAYRGAGAVGTGYCGLGSVKANVGHTDAAAGVASFIKVALMLYHCFLPPHPTFRHPNPEIDFAASPFTPHLNGAPWPRAEHPRRAAVSSFGIGGTNVHMVMEEAPPRPPADPGRPWQLLTLSARDTRALSCTAQSCAAFLEDNPQANLADVAYTLAVGRRSFGHRLAGAFDDRASAARAFREGAPLLSGNAGIATPEELVFLFPGGGAQHVDMGRGLYTHEPVYRDAVEECLLLFPNPAVAGSTRGVMFPSAADQAAPEITAAVADPTLGLPALFITEVALGKLLLSLGLHPTMLLGHSVGEYTAAYFAGVFSLRDALTIVLERGRILAGVPDGAMLSVAATERDVEPLLTSGVSLAAVNGRSLCVLAGPAKRIRAVGEDLAAQGISCRTVPFTTAAHSALLDPILPQFRQLLSGVRLHAPTTRLVSNVYGRAIDDEATDPEYWVTHLRTTVRFADGLDYVLAAGRPALVEVGPGTTLATLARQHLPAGSEAVVVSTARHPHEQRDDQEVLLSAVGRLWVSGVDLDLAAVHTGERRIRVPAVQYPFASVPCRLEPPQRPSPRTDLTGLLYGVSWRRCVDVAQPDSDVLAARRWIVLSDCSELAQEFSQALRHHGVAPIVVTPGTEFQRLDATSFVFAPGCKEHYGLLLDAAGRTPTPLCIVDFWVGLCAGDDGPDLASTLGIAHAASHSAEDLKLCVVTRGAFDITGGERLIPRAACAVAASRTLPLELPQISVTIVDLDPAEVEGPNRARLGRDLLADITCRGRPDLLGRRSGHRWLQHFEPLDAAELSGPPLRPGGVYLITGGLGGIGLRVAEHLARAYRARLVLVGRSMSEPPTLAALRGLGAEILLRCADVADRIRLKEVLRETQQRFGVIHGVVHAAGVPGGGMVQFLSPDDVTAALRAKVAGTSALVDILRETGATPDFVVLFSSLAALSGAPGQACYAAANAFLDTFARHASRDLGVPTLSINWDRWRGLGMAADAPRHRSFQSAAATAGMDGDTAVAKFMTCLAATALGQIVVSTLPPGELCQAIAASVAPTAGRPDDDAVSGTVRSDDITEPRTSLEQNIAAIWGEVLGVAKIGVHDNFFELGGHSLLALQIVQRCKDRLNLTVTVEGLFTARTVAGLAQELASSKGRSGNDGA